MGGRSLTPTTPSAFLVCPLILTQRLSTVSLRQPPASPALRVPPDEPRTVPRSTLVTALCPSSCAYAHDDVVLGLSQSLPARLAGGSPFQKHGIYDKAFSFMHPVKIHQSINKWGEREKKGFDRILASIVLLLAFCAIQGSSGSLTRTGLLPTSAL